MTLVKAIEREKGKRGKKGCKSPSMEGRTKNKGGLVPKWGITEKRGKAKAKAKPDKPPDQTPNKSTISNLRSPPNP